MLKQVYVINENGYLQEIKVAEFDEKGNCLEILESNTITTDVPQGLYKPKWTGTEWISSMTEAEYIVTLPELPEREPTEEQQRITDLELAIAEILGGGL